ncbi:MAG: hypothetical protein FWF20_07830 [Betaproteobacteria bacterium]|nr:hypothetical protein [Betaproteobacteria bacterium]MCL2886672.1 hypothetical protein [Betaproteobacteria bacterium]
MKRLLLLLAAAGLLSACAAPSSPRWLLETDAALNAWREAWLGGDERVASHELALARREVGRGGDATLMARIELTVCAAQVASLAANGCSPFQPLAADAGASENAYAAWLAGANIAAEQLPAVQRRAWQSGATADLAAIADPLSRLLAAAMLRQSGRLPDDAHALAIDTAAEQGWRRPLLAWLAADRDRLLARGEDAAAAERQRRIERIVASGR